MKKNIYKKATKRARKKESNRTLSGDVIVNTIADASQMEEWESILLDDENPAAKSFTERCKGIMSDYSERVKLASISDALFGWQWLTKGSKDVTDDHNPGT